MTIYVVRTYSQQLLSGNWSDGSWDWVEKNYKFKDLDSARKFVAAIEICNDLPIARIFKETVSYDDGYSVDYELIDEKS